jgi:hypothetical protein
MQASTDIAHLIASAVAPVFLLTGVAAMLAVLTNRLARIVDRARTLEDRLESRTGKTKELHADLMVLARRARYINLAISLCAVAAVMVAAVVVTLFANAFFGLGIAGVIASLFVGSLLLLSAAFITFFIEVRYATAALRIGAPHF